MQAAQSTWTEADLIRHLGERLPAQVGAMSAAEAAALLPALARQALATEAVMLAAPEWPRVPDSLRRASGESVYIPHGAARYATSAQLTLEDRLLAHAQEPAPRAWTPPPPRACSARNRRSSKRNSRRRHHSRPSPSGSAPGCASTRPPPHTAALTSARRAEVLAGPAGSGKTRTVAEMARLWRRRAWAR